MILFIHDLGASRSFWLPQIRGLLSLDNNYSDQELLDLFTIALPGHNNLDSEFEIGDVKKQIDKAVEEKMEKQRELGSKLFLSHDAEIIKTLKTDKIILVGHGLGGVLSINYAFYKPKRVDRMILVSCGNEFNSFALKMRSLYYRFLFRISAKVLSRRSVYSTDPRKKNLYYLVSENPQRKGIKSGFKIIRDYKFSSSFGKLSLDSQIDFVNIPILTIHGKRELLSNPKSGIRLKSAVRLDQDLLKSRKTIISVNDKDRAQTNKIVNRIYKGVGKNPQDKKLVDFVYDSRKFLSV